MHGNSGASSHGGGQHGAPPHSTPHPPPPHHTSHMHPNLLPHPMLISGNNSHQPVGSCNAGELSPPQHPHQSNLPMSLNMPTQNPMIPPHPMIAAAARAAQLVNFPIRPPPPPPCSVGLSTAGPFPHTNFSSTMSSPKRPSPESSPVEPVSLSSPRISHAISSQFSSCLTSSRHIDFTANITSSSNGPITTSSSRSSKGSGFTIDNIIGDQRRSDSSNNNNMVRNDEHSDEEKEDEVRLKIDKCSSPIQKERLDKYESNSHTKEEERVKIEKDDEDTSVVADKVYDVKNYEETSKLMQQMHPTSNLPSFLHCAMLGKMVTTNSENDSSIDLYQNKDKFKRSAISPLHLQSSHYQNSTKEDSWK